jgi:hypothetical protein
VSRETAWIWDSEGVFEGSGLGSKAARLPRSKVTGIAFVIVSAESSIADMVCCVNQVAPSDKQEEIFSQPIAFSLNQNIHHCRSFLAGVGFDFVM